MKPFLPLLLLTVGCGHDGVLRLEDDNNYDYVNNVIGETDVILQEADCTFDWSALTTDLQGHPVDPAADIDWLTLIRFIESMTLDDIKTAISEDVLETPMTAGIVQFENTREGTTAEATEFSVLTTNFFDPARDFVGDGIFMIRLTTGLNDTRMIGFFTLTEDGPQLLEIGDDDAALDFTADIEGSDSVDMSVKMDSIDSIDWSAVTKTAGGKDFNPNAVDRLIVARYDDEAVADLEANFFDIELDASDEWEAAISGGVTDLPVTDLTSVADGSAFPGFEAGLYLVGLQYTIGTNPAPLFLAVVNIED